MRPATKLKCKYQCPSCGKWQPFGVYDGRTHDIYKRNEKDKIPRNVQKHYICIFLYIYIPKMLLRDQKHGLNKWKSTKILNWKNCHHKAISVFPWLIFNIYIFWGNYQREYLMKWDNFEVHMKKIIVQN